MNVMHTTHAQYCMKWLGTLWEIRGSNVFLVEGLKQRVFGFYIFVFSFTDVVSWILVRDPQEFKSVVENCSIT